MSYTGVTINGTDTLTQWGLILLDDVTIEEARLKETLIDVKGTDGLLNLSYGLTGGAPTFNNRNISFTLFASGLSRSGNQLLHARPKNEEEVNLIRTELQGLYHGREVDLYLPDDTTHYWHGILSVGAKSKFNSGRIPITLNAYPYRLKSAQTTRTITIPTGGSTTVSLTNEQRRVVPTVTTTGAITIRKGNDTWSINAGTTKLSGLYLDAGTTSLTVTGTRNTSVTFTYQEGRL